MLVDKNLSKNELFNKLNSIGKELIIKILPNYFDNKIILKDQNEQEATYASKINPKMTQINFNENVKNVFNKIRAFSPKPGAWFLFKNERIKIIICKKTIEKSIPPKIINEHFHIGCNDGIIVPIVIQREGKKPMEIKEFLRGFTFSVGQTINA